MGSMMDEGRGVGSGWEQGRWGVGRAQVNAGGDVKRDGEGGGEWVYKQSTLGARSGCDTRL